MIISSFVQDITITQRNIVQSDGQPRMVQVIYWEKKANLWYQWQTFANKRDQMSDVEPQGSNLDPVILLLYINDLPNCLETTKATLFADDTNLTGEGYSSHEIEYKLNEDLEIIPLCSRVNVRLAPG